MARKTGWKLRSVPFVRAEAAAPMLDDPLMPAINWPSYVPPLDYPVVDPRGWWQVVPTVTFDSTAVNTNSITSGDITVRS